MNRLLFRIAVLVMLVVGDWHTANAFVPLLTLPARENSNALVNKHRAKIKATASSSYGGGYVPEALIDGKVETTWFSASGDSAAKGRTPWVQFEFPEDVTIQRVTILGNRDPSYPKGYSILEGKIEYLDKNGKQLGTEQMKGTGATHDFEFRPRKLMQAVRSIRFTSTKDEGDQNGSTDVALSEILVE